MPHRLLASAPSFHHNTRPLPSFLPSSPAIICILYLCGPAQCLMSPDHMAVLLDPTIWEGFQKSGASYPRLHKSQQNNTKLTIALAEQAK